MPNEIQAGDLVEVIDPPGPWTLVEHARFALGTRHRVRTIIESGARANVVIAIPSPLTAGGYLDIHLSSSRFRKISEGVEEIECTCSSAQLLWGEHTCGREKR
jgi:hypothetical protein